jgi:hypothetical protein
MKKGQDEFLYLTVYSESDRYIEHKYGQDNGIDYFKIELTTGTPESPREVDIIIRHEDDYIMSFRITETTARYICNYLKTYLDVINDKK